MSDAAGEAPPAARATADAHHRPGPTPAEAPLPHDEEPHHVEPPHARGIRSEQAADIILRIRPSRLALSTALEKAVRWTLSESELSIFFTSEYPANAARGEEEVIRNAAADVLGKPVLVRIKVDAAAGGDPGSDASGGRDGAGGDHDEQVEMVKRVFRGEIVDG